MIFSPLAIGGAFAIDLERSRDERGYFARAFCQREFEARGLVCAFVQCNVSFNARPGTLRGLHYQAPPHPETKLVRCTRGALYDVLVDLRPDSPTFCNWAGAELSAQSGRTLYVPAGLAHGFVTLTDDTEVFYQMSTPYEPELARGVRWDDPAFGIDWPPISDPFLMSERDRRFPDFVP